MAGGCLFRRWRLRPIGGTVIEYDLNGWFDGSCAPINPGGTGGAAWVLREAQGEESLVDKQIETLQACPTMTNNVAEYFALANMLEFIEAEMPATKKVLIRGDSKLVIQQITGKWKAKKGAYLEQFLRAKAVLERLRVAG